LAWTTFGSYLAKGRNKKMKSSKVTSLGDLAFIFHAKFSNFYFLKQKLAYNRIGVQQSHLLQLKMINYSPYSSLQCSIKSRIYHSLIIPIICYLTWKTFPWKRQVRLLYENWQLCNIFPASCRLVPAAREGNTASNRAIYRTCLSE
jgi:hypothetical protein